MTRLTNIARRASSTATLGLLALAFALSGTMVSSDSSPADRLCGDRLVKMAATMGDGTGCLRK